MESNKNKETSRLQIRIPIELKDQLEKAVKQNVMGINNSKSLMVSIALVCLFNQMRINQLDEIYVNEYIPLLKEINNPSGSSFLGDD